jgi:pimeloyl-ACP methyl ester carboxylesterase
MVSIDRPGFGFSDFGNAMHLKDQCDIILPVLRKFKTDKPLYLCGHSMGAPIAVELAADAPELFAKIVLVGCSIDVKLEKKETWRRIMNVKPMYWALPGAFGPSNTELLYLKNDLYKLQPSFKNVTCDVYFIHGDEDDWVPIQNIAYGKQMMTNARSITADTIFGAGHLIPWENRTAFTDLLLHIDSTKKYAKVQISQCVN